MYHKVQDLLNQNVNITTMNGDVYIGQITEVDDRSDDKSDYTVTLGKNLAAFTFHDEAPCKEYTIRIDDISTIGAK